MPTESPKSFRERFIVVSDQDINLKFLFDHMRNYLICGALLFGGAKIIPLKSSFLEIPHFGVAAGVTLAVMGYGLFMMNTFQGMYAFVTYAKLKPQSSFRDYVATVLFTAFYLLVFLEFMGARFG